MAINKLNIFYDYLPIMITTLLLESSETGMINKKIYIFPN